MRLAVIAACLLFSAVATLAANPVIGKSRPIARDCSIYYPKDLARDYIEGTVTVRYDVAATGDIVNVTISKTSGNAALDAAGVTCATLAWKNLAATSDGTPVAEPGHEAEIDFRMPEPRIPIEYFMRGSAFERRGLHDRAISDFTQAIALAPRYAAAYSARAAVYRAVGQSDLAARDIDMLKTIPSPPRAVANTHNCDSYYPRAAAENFEEGDVIVGYDVSADGAISNIAVVRSSGYQRLDDAAFACVRERWHDTPAVLNGVAVASPGHQAVIRFMFENASTAAEFALAGSGFLKAGNYGAAILAFTRAIALDSGYIDAYRGRAMAYDAQGLYSLAMADRTKLAQLLNPGAPH
jgi:TonB family protein